jgi:ABC-2 type transport system ATP-binding protein
MSVLVLDHTSRWFGNVVAVNDVSMTLGPGVTGLLGPNGAGKSTLINMMSGFLAPSSGSVTLDGEPVWHREQVYRSIGLVPETESVMQGISGWGFVLANARLQGVEDPEAAARHALEIVDLVDVKDRAIGTYSKGMRQRVKLASALVHDPPVLLLDEPFNGMDPRQRLHLMGVLGDLAAAGRTVVFSSHILEEVEELAQTIQVMVAGRHAASGDFREFRRLMIERPHRYTLRSTDDRALASLLLAAGLVSTVELTADGAHVQTFDLEALARALPAVAREHRIRLAQLSPDDESLESVFSYLVNR